MKVTFLGTGTSTGVPTVGCNCPTCRSKDPHDARFRCSSLIEVKGKNILIDCGPDFRLQALRAGITHLDAVLLTHAHYDHVGGIDDLRSLTYGHPVDVYGNSATCDGVKKLFFYCFRNLSPTAAPHYVGMLSEMHLHHVDDGLESFDVAGSVNVKPVRAMHRYLPVTGYRIGDFGYLTDFKTIEKNELDKLKGLDVLVLGMLRSAPHGSHLSYGEAVEVVDYLKPRKTYFVHMSHSIGKTSRPVLTSMHDFKAFIDTLPPEDRALQPYSQVGPNDVMNYYEYDKFESEEQRKMWEKVFLNPIRPDCALAFDGLTLEVDDPC